jgi:hypothetical protein
MLQTQTTEKLNNMKKISTLIIASFVGLAAHAQIIDTLTSGHNNSLTGGLVGYTAIPVLDNSFGTGAGVWFPSSASGLSASFVGTNTTAEQDLFLAPANTFGTIFAVGKMLTVNVAMPVSTTQMDFGLAIAAASPVAANAGNSWSSRTAFDWASISVRPNQTAIRANSSISGTLVTGNGVLSAAANTVSQLYIQWVSADVFNLGYVDTSSVQHLSETITFAGASTIGSEIGFYGDLRATGTSLGNFSNLAITTIPEPSTLAMCGMGLAGLLVAMRRKK